MDHKDRWLVAYENEISEVMENEGIDSWTKAARIVDSRIDLNHGYIADSYMCYEGED